MQVEKSKIQKAQELVDNLNQIQQSINKQSCEIARVYIDQQQIRTKKKRIDDLNYYIKHYTEEYNSLLAQLGELQIELDSLPRFKNYSIKQKIADVKTDIGLRKHNIELCEAQIKKEEGEINDLTMTASTKSVLPTIQSIQKHIATYNTYLDELADALETDIQSLKILNISGEYLINGLFIRPLAIKENSLVITNESEEDENE